MKKCSFVKYIFTIMESIAARIVFYFHILYAIPWLLSFSFLNPKCMLWKEWSTKKIYRHFDDITQTVRVENRFAILIFNIISNLSDNPSCDTKLIRMKVLQRNLCFIGRAAYYFFRIHHQQSSILLIC